MENNSELNIALDAALRAGGAIMEIYKRDFEVEFKADDSPLTEADKAAHHIIVDALEDTGFPVLSEESRQISYEERKEWKTYWLVDPLDGTKEFIKKNGEFTVNIALIKDGCPVMGVVYAPVLQTLYYGIVHGAEGMEQGAWKAIDCADRSINEILSASSSCSMPQAQRGEVPLRVVASRSHCNEETEKFIGQLEKEFETVELVSNGSSLKLCMVADGSADIYPRIAPTMEWDTAAAHAVVSAAGGRAVEYDPDVPAVSYLSQSAKRKAQDEETAPGCTLHALRYNKEDLLNPFFVVSR